MESGDNFLIKTSNSIKKFSKLTFTILFRFSSGGNSDIPQTIDSKTLLDLGVFLLEVF